MFQIIVPKSAKKLTFVDQNTAMEKTYGMTVEYHGELRCEGTHVRSKRTVLTDAPLDNNGKAEAFSPTDLLCTSLASCMITIMGITAEQKGIQLGKISAGIVKVMASDPRRVIEIQIDFTMEDCNYSEKEKSILKNAALACPVAKSLHPDIRQIIEFTFQ